MVSMRLDVKDDDASRKLAALRRDMPTIDRILRRTFAENIAGRVKSEYLTGQVLKVRTGYLRKSIAYRDESATTTKVGSFGPPYARIHELGGDIYPKKGKYLWFKLPTHIVMHMSKKSGKMRAEQKWSGWIAAKHVRIPARPYLLPGITRYFSDGSAERTANKVLDRELAKREAK